MRVFVSSFIRNVMLNERENAISRIEVLRDQPGTGWVLRIPSQLAMHLMQYLKSEGDVRRIHVPGSVIQVNSESPVSPRRTARDARKAFVCVTPRRSILATRSCKLECFSERDMFPRPFFLCLSELSANRRNLTAGDSRGHQPRIAMTSCLPLRRVLPYTTLLANLLFSNVRAVLTFSTDYTGEMQCET